MLDQAPDALALEAYYTSNQMQRHSPGGILGMGLDAEALVYSRIRHGIRPRGTGKEHTRRCVRRRGTGLGGVLDVGSDTRGTALECIRHGIKRRLTGLRAYQTRDQMQRQWPGGILDVRSAAEALAWGIIHMGSDSEALAWGIQHVRSDVIGTGLGEIRGGVRR